MRKVRRTVGLLVLGTSAYLDDLARFTIPEERDCEEAEVRIRRATPDPLQEIDRRMNRGQSC